MTNLLPQIDEFCFEKQLRAFKRFVEDTSGIPLVSFGSNPYLEDHEGYKYEIYRKARKALDFVHWKSSDVGSGRIAAAVVAAIELPENNLVPWQPRYGKARRPHHSLCVAIEESSGLAAYEQVFYDLFYGPSDAQVFNRLLELFGRKYDLLAYLFFLKDRTRYMPIAPQYFDTAFGKLGVAFKTSRQCSWNNLRPILMISCSRYSSTSAAGYRATSPSSTHTHLPGCLRQRWKTQR
jgi:hypothetical protein